MTFMAPALAWMALAAVAVPIAIHLLMRRRKQPVRWAAMELLQRAVRRRARRSKLERLLLLMARCLLLAAAGFAIAGPGWQGVSGAGRGVARDVVIVLDQSVASLAEGPGGSGSLIDRSKGAASEVLAAVSPGDRVAVIGMAAADGRFGIVWPPSSDIASVGAAIEAIEPMDIGARPRAALAWAVDALRHEHDREALVGQAARQPAMVVLSGWTEGTLDAPDDAAAADVERALAWVTGNGGSVELLEPSKHEAENRWMTVMRPEHRGPSGDASGIGVRWTAHRAGGEMGQEQVPTALCMADRSGSRTAMASFATRETEVAMATSLEAPPPPLREVGVRASMAPDAQPADDEAFSVVGIASRCAVLVVDRQRFQGGDIEETQPSTWVERALSPDGIAGVEVDRRDPTALEAGAAPEVDAIFVLQPDLVTAAAWQRIGDAVRGGSGLVVTPPAGARDGSWAAGLERELPGTFVRGVAEEIVFSPPMPLDPTQPASDTLELLAPELGDLAAPVEVTRAIRLGGGAGQQLPEGGATLVRLANGDPFLVEVQPESVRGRVILCAVPLSLGWSNLPTKPMVVPLLHEIVRMAAARRSAGHGAWLGSTGVHTVPWPAARRMVQVLGRSDASGDMGGQSVSVEPGGMLSEPMTSAGLYEALDAGGKPLGRLAVNVDPRRASNVTSSPATVLPTLAGTGAMDGVRFLGMEESGAGRPTESPSDATEKEAPVSENSRAALALLACATLLWLVEGALARVGSHAGALLPRGSP